MTEQAKTMPKVDIQICVRDEKCKGGQGEPICHWCLLQMGVATLGRCIYEARLDDINEGRRGLHAIAHLCVADQGTDIWTPLRSNLVATAFLLIQSQVDIGARAYLDDSQPEGEA